MEMVSRISIAFALAFCVSAAAIAQKPAENINPGRHPNLAAAQRFVDQAFNKITAAQKANEWDMSGHAEKAKRLLDEANAELKLAAVTANKR
jgi:hypothetical protein